ncbi:SDR family oxidoreductase [Pedobacter rhizosphaerae]|uniref:Short-chain dehydrogenase n=1 Tax=Pedobacter rhizosphaerae TaxID=390241 RepID=A0A1H9WAY0_9SPHI|nr:SDR family oxidoreductase [Pedobacter rhizosphaerae]SES31060.1 Short-chain dehydrogenase [Pedobacter rhizosphaerae]
MQTIFITGASSGLGKATAQLFQKQGWRVIATMRNVDNEFEVSKLENVILLPLDVTDVAQIQATVKNVVENYEVDVVFNNAGYGLIGALESFEDAQIERQIATNLMGVIRITQAFVPYFRAKRRGMFINVTSSFGIIGFPTCSIYSATKFAVDGFSESMSYELAQFGVVVKVLAPGGIQTDFATRSVDVGQHEAYSQLTVEVSKGYSSEKIAQYARVEDIAEEVFTAVNDGTVKLRYVVGKDATALYEERIRLGAEEQVQRIKNQFIF